MYGRCTSCFLAIRSTVYVLTPQNPKTEFCKAYEVKKLFFGRILITGSPIPIPFLPKNLSRCMEGARHVSWPSDLQFMFWPPKTQKLSFAKPTWWKNCFSCVSWKPVLQFQFRFFLKLSVDVWKVHLMFLGYQIYGLHFDPQKPKNWVLQSLRGDKVVFRAYLDNR